MVSSQIFKRYPQTNHYLLSPSLFPGFMEYEPTMISFLSFCSYVSCASPTSPWPVLVGDPVHVRSCQVLTHLCSKFSKTENRWSWMSRQRDSLQYFVYIWLNFSMARSLKKKKRPRPSKGLPSEKPKSLQQRTVLGPCEATFSLLLFATTSRQSHNLLPAQFPPESFCTRCLLCLEHSFPVYLHGLLLFRICRNAILWRASMAHPTLI